MQAGKDQASLHIHAVLPERSLIALKRMLVKAQTNNYGPVHESLVLVTYASVEGPGEHTHSCNTLEK